jgi:hypothetical protein
MNTDQENQLAAKIASLLDQAARDIDTPIAAKLLEVRKEALAHFQEKPVRAWTPAWATEAVGRITEPFGYNLRAGLVLLAFLAAVAGGVAWQTISQQGSEFAEIDEALLTDELPINAYLDKGFDSWVKRP